MNETELKKIAEMMRQLDMTAGEAMKNGNLPDAILAYERMMDAEEYALLTYSIRLIF